VLSRLVGNYEITLVPHLVSPPHESAAPERARLAHWSLRDAATLAKAYGLQAPQSSQGGLPGASAVQATEEALAAALDAGTFVAQAASISAGLWQATAPGLPHALATPERVAACKSQGDALRKRCAHTGGVMAETLFHLFAVQGFGTGPTAQTPAQHRHQSPAQPSIHPQSQARAQAVGPRHRAAPERAAQTDSQAC
jgi:hypothetical protein